MDSISNFIRKVQNKSIDIVEHTQKALDEIEKINSEYKYFNVICAEEAISQAEQLAGKDLSNMKLAGLPISIKDCICVKGVESRAGSKILTGYKPLFDATAVRMLKDQGAIILGKTSQDEFGFGSFNLNVGVGFQVPFNPIDKSRVCGGSSGGSAGVTARLGELGIPHVSLAESTGGSIACPASFCGVAGLTPTYGRVSRYGLMDYANSLDKIGTMANSVADAAYALELVSGFDENDTTSLREPVDEYSGYASKDCSGMKIGIIKESFGKGVDKEVAESVLAAVSKLEKKGAQAQEISLPLTTKYSLSAYYIIAMSEASTNLAKYCGIRYGIGEKLEGNYNEYFSKVRSNNFGTEAKRRIMLGTFARMAGYRDAYYLKALSVRTKIIQEYKKLFSRFDALVSPTMPFIAPKLSDVKALTPMQNYMADIMTVGPNIAGLPHLSVKVGEHDKMPVGMMLIGNHLMEKKIVQLGGCLER